MESHMDGRTIWLVFNEASGSNDEAALAALDNALGRRGCRVARRICFPEDALPPIAEIGRDPPDWIVVFAGDGTVHAVVTGLYGWGGAVLVLPGGTMNLLSRRLHGEADAREIIARACAGQCQTVRPTVIDAVQGDALTGVLAGPGTEWNEVREAMRNTDIAGMVGAAADAAGASVEAPRVICAQPVLGRPDGYAAIMLTPTESGIAVRGYHADSLADYAGQAMALARGDFRDGPHDRLGTLPELSLAMQDGAGMDLLVDGEPRSGGTVERFSTKQCEVDLLATQDVF
jgi:hypothetical protein